MAAAISSELRQLADQARPVALAQEQALPVAPALGDLLPGGGLRRGAPVAVRGEAALSLALALVATASATGSWVAAMGLPSLGLAAAAELGIALEHLVLVREPPPPAWAAVASALVGAFDVVLLGPIGRARAGEVRRLVARARERGSVLVQVEVGPAPGAGRGDDLLGPEVRLATVADRWVGLGEGFGRLRARHVVVEATGRRAAARPRRVERWFAPDALDEGRVVVTADPPDWLPGATITSLDDHRAAG